MKYEDELEFPCGLKIKTKLKMGLSILGVSGTIGFDNKKLYEQGCPIHGKKCGVGKK